VDVRCWQITFGKLVRQNVGMGIELATKTKDKQSLIA
jgi:hypothetical protein